MQLPPLSSLRVLELGSDDAISYCGKLFADFGAEVIKVEPPGGDPLRHVLPLIDVGYDRQENAWAAWLNSNKNSIIIDTSSTDGEDEIFALLKSCDLLIDGRPLNDIQSGQLAHTHLRETMPSLAITGMSWFGEYGPYAKYAATETTCRSLSGCVKYIGTPDAAPILPREGQIASLAGMAAFIPTLAGLYDRALATRRYMVSKLETFVHVSEFDTALSFEAGFARPRLGINRFGRGFPLGNYKTRDGWLGITVVTPAQWSAFTQMIGRPELAKDPRFETVPNRYANAAELTILFEPILLQKTAAEWFEMGIELRLPLAVVPTMAELLKQRVYRERKAFGTVHIGETSFEAPALPQYLTQTPPSRNARAPLPGEHNPACLKPREVAGTRAATRNDRLPLEGVRVIDLTMGWAGPSATRQLADQGADIIKVESCQYPDWFRGTDPRPPYHAEKTYEKAYLFQLMNRNKRGITLNLTDKRGLDLLRKLLATADAVIDNYAADVLPRMGLDAKAMHAINPRLVVVTMPAFGMTGAWSGVRAYGSTLEQASGLPSVNGRPEDPPTMLHTALGDPVGGFNAATSLMIGLMHQKQTGKGQHIDLSQVECLFPLAAPSIIEQATRGTTGPRLGNRHPVYVPHGCFRSFGEDQWITIAVRSDDEWQALCKVIRRDDLANDQELATADGRRKHEDRIEQAITEWSSAIRPDLAMVKLQEAGIASGVARSSLDTPHDPHLLTVGHWRPMIRPFIGPHLLPAPAYREHGDQLPYSIRRLPPTLGEHSREVLSEILGICEEDLDALQRDDVIGTEAVQKIAG